MLWLYLVLLAYFINAVVFIIDKYLLAAPIPNYRAYAFGVSILSLSALALIPFGVSWYGWGYLLIALFSGGLFFIGLNFLYRSIKESDISIAATQTGTTTAIFTYIFSIIILKEILYSANFSAFLFLVLGIFLLGKIEKRILFSSILAGLFFGLSFVFLKLSFNESDFINGLFWTRIGFVGNAFSSLMSSRVRREIRSAFLNASDRSKFIFVFNKIIAGIGFIILYFAIDLGSLTLVNALLGFQFLFIIILVLILRKKMTKIEKKLSPKILISKLIGISSIILGFLLLFSNNSTDGPKIYGVSFSRFHTDELKIDWKETYLAILDDLEVRNLRFSAHWPLTEPEEGEFNFEELDFQIKEAEKRNASVILAVGRRLPGWPECHEPDWMKDKDTKFKQEKLLEYIEAVVKRYKDSPIIKYWQVENEPHLVFFSRSACGDFDQSFLLQEINFVKSLDPTRPILMTDSGELGTWHKAYREGDAFGTSIYLYLWNSKIGAFRYPITPAFFRIKRNIVQLVFGEKESMAVEISSEPWLLQPIVEAPINTQLERMDINKFNEMIEFSQKTGFNKLYFWGAEWWYWMKLNGHGEFWNRAREIF